MSRTRYKTTKRDFEFFKKACREFKNMLGLSEWEIEYRHKPYQIKEQKALAWFLAYPEIFRGTIGLAPTWDKTKVDKETIRKSAFHEMCHIALSALVLASEKDREKEEHRLINRMENAIYGEDD